MYLSNSQIKHKNMDADLWFLQHQHNLLDETDIVQNETLIEEL